MISIKQFSSSLSYAVHGVCVVFEQEQSFRIQIIFSIVVLALAWYYPVRGFELMAIFLLIGSVLVLEMINSVFERIVDTLKPRIHPMVKDIKDIMAGTVLVTSFTAFCVGVVIFGPHLFLSFSNFWIY